MHNTPAAQPAQHRIIPHDRAGQQLPTDLHRHLVAAEQADQILDDDDVDLIDALSDAEAERPGLWTPGPDDEAKAERYLRAVAHFRSEQDRINDQANAEIKRIEAWREKRLTQPRNALGYLQHMLQLFSDCVGRERRVSPAGILKWVKGREVVEIDDPAAFCALHSDTDLVRWKSEPSKTAITAVLKSTGEIPEGAEIVRRDDVFKVEVA